MLNMVDELVCWLLLDVVAELAGSEQINANVYKRAYIPTRIQPMKTKTLRCEIFHSEIIISRCAHPSLRQNCKS
jgi:hypothetical protein